MTQYQQQEANQNTSSKMPLWSFVPLTDYPQPSIIGSSAVQLKWGLFKRSIKFGKAKEQIPLIESSHLHSLAETRLNRLVAHPSVGILWLKHWMRH